MKQIGILGGMVLMLLSPQLVGQQYQVRLAGFRQLSEYELGFMIQVRNAGELPWAYNAGQYQVVFDSLSLRGGILNGAMVVPGSSLPPGQQLADEEIFWAGPLGALTCSAPAMAAGSPLMLMDHQEWRTIVPLVVSLQDATDSSFISFADGPLGWTLRRAGTRVFAAGYYIDDSQALRGEGPGAPGTSRQLAAGSLVAEAPARQLAGSWFYDAGNWNDPQRWNVALRSTAPGGQPQLPGPHANVQIAGQATLPGGLLVSLLPSNTGQGGQLVVGEATDGQAPPALTIAPGAGLRVSQLVNDQGAQAINLEASAAGSSWLIHDNQGAQARVQCYLEGTGGQPQAFRLIASPAQQSPMAAFAEVCGSPGPSIWRWEPHTASWEAAHMEHDTFAPGRGYRVAVTHEVTGVFGGVLTATDVALDGLSPHCGAAPNGHDQGWHLLGNPFAGALAWEPGQWQLSNICHTAQVYDPRAGSYRLLRPGQAAAIGVAEGFFVHVAAGPPGSLVMPAAARLPGTAAGPHSTPPGLIVLTATQVQQGLVQPTLIGFDQSATAGYDLMHDAPFMGGAAPGFWSEAGGLRLAANIMAQATAQLVVPLGFEARSAGSYLIALEQDPGALPLTLFDRLLQTSHPLVPGQGYAFAATPDDPPQRFELHFREAPVATTPPAQGPTRITLSGTRLCIDHPPAGATRLELFALNGTLLLQHPLQPLPHQCLEVNLPHGVYVVRLEGPGATRAVVVSG